MKKMAKTPIKQGGKKLATKAMKLKTKLTKTVKPKKASTPMKQKNAKKPSKIKVKSKTASKSKVTSKPKVALKSKVKPKVTFKPKATVKVKVISKTKAMKIKTVPKAKKAAPKVKAKPKAKIISKVKATPKAKTKAKATPKAKAATSKHKAKKAPVKLKSKSKKIATPKKIVVAPKTKVLTKPKKTITPQKPKIKIEGKTEKQKKIMTTKTTTPQLSKTIKQTALNNAIGPIDIEPYQAKPNEEYMNPAQTQHFTKLLLKWKEQLLEEAVTTKKDIQATSANFPDPVDRASLEEEFNLELRARDRERKLIKKIDETLQRIKETSYGYCDDCGAEIGVRRLEARPTASQCIECKTISELKERQVGEIGREED